MLIVPATQEAPVGGWLESRVLGHPRQQGSLKVSHIWTGFTIYDFRLLTLSVLTFLKREGGMGKVTVMWFVYVRDLWCEDALWTSRSYAWLPSLSMEEVCWSPHLDPSCSRPWAEEWMDIVLEGVLPISPSVLLNAVFTQPFLKHFWHSKTLDHISGPFHNTCELF